MKLTDQSARLGHWLLRRQGYLPLMFLGFSAAALCLARPFGIRPESAAISTGCLALALGGIAVRMHCAGVDGKGLLAPQATQRPKKGELPPNPTQEQYAPRDEPWSSALRAPLRKEVREQGEKSPEGPEGKLDNDHGPNASIAGELGPGWPTGGLYRYCRHPRRLGSGLIWCGLMFYTGVAGWVLSGLLLYGGTTLLLMIAQEQQLSHRFGKAYDHYAERTNALLPRVIKRTDEAEPQYGAVSFSTRRAAATTARDLLGVMTAFAALAILRNRVIDFEWTLPQFWVWSLTGCAFLWGVVWLTARIAR